MQRSPVSFFRRQIFSIAFFSLFLAGGSVLAQSTWTGATNSNWNDAGNWTGGIPVNGTVLNFGAAPTNMATNMDISGLTTGAINFTYSGATASPVTIGTLGQSITLGGNITTTAAATNITTDVINLNLILDNNRTVTTNSFHALTIHGEISSTTFGLVKAGAQVLTLTNANSSFSGPLTINQGTVTTTSLAASGVNSAIGSGSLIVLGSVSGAATLTYTGTATGTTTVDRGLTLAHTGANGATINNNGSGPLVFSGTFANSQTAGAKTLTLGGTNTGLNEFQSAIVNGSGGTLAVTKANAGTWILSGNNSYSGTTTVSAGLLRLNHSNAIPSTSNIVMSGGLLGLGAGDLSRTFGTGANQISITGANSGFAAFGADRTVNLGAALQWGATTGADAYNQASLLLSHATATHTITLSSGLTMAATGTRTLNVADGAADVDAAVSGQISGGSTTGLSKGGAGTLVLSNTANNWVGQTFVDGGTLRLGASEVLPSVTLTVKRGTGQTATGVLDLAGFNETIGALNLGETNTNAGNVGQTPTVIDSGTTKGGLTLGGAITYNAGSAGFENGQATISANVNTGGAGRNIVLGDGSAGDDLVISGAISGAGTLTKQGAGTLMISGANTHTGALNIQQGTVKLGASGVLPDGNSLQLGVGASVAGVVVDLNGFSETVGPLILGSPSPANAGLTHSIINSGTPGAVLTLTNSFTYNAGGTSQNGQATISADLNTGDNARNLTVNDSSVAAMDVLISGKIVGTTGFNKSGAGTLGLSAANTFNGVTRPGTGTLMLQNNLALQNSPVNVETSSTGTISLDAGITTPTFGGLRGERNLSTVITSGYGSVTQVTLNPGTGSSSTYSGVIADGATGMNVVKSGAGTQVFTGTNTYTGTTSVNEGTLQVGNAGVGTTGTGAVTVISGGTVIGSGNLIGSSFTAATGSTVHAGDSISAIGTLTFTPASGSGAFDFQSGSTTVLGIQSGGPSDLLNFVGTGSNTLTFNGNLTISGSLSPLAAEVFNLMDWTGLGSTPTFASRFDAASYGGFLLGNGDDNLGFDLPDISTSGFAWDISQFTTDGTIAIVVVPEPSRALLLIIGLLGLITRRRRH